MVLEGRTFVAVRTSDAAGPGGRQTFAQGPQREHDRTTCTKTRFPSPHCFTRQERPPWPCFFYRKGLLITKLMKKNS